MMLNKIKCIQVSENAKFFYDLGFVSFPMATRILNIQFVAFHGFETV